MATGCQVGLLCSGREGVNMDTFSVPGSACINRVQLHTMCAQSCTCIVFDWCRWICDVRMQIKHQLNKIKTHPTGFSCSFPQSSIVPWKRKFYSQPFLISQSLCQAPYTHLCGLSLQHLSKILWLFLLLFEWLLQNNWRCACKNIVSDFWGLFLLPLNELNFFMWPWTSRENIAP